MLSGSMGLTMRCDMAGSTKSSACGCRTLGCRGGICAIPRRFCILTMGGLIKTRNFGGSTVGKSSARDQRKSYALQMGWPSLAWQTLGFEYFFQEKERLADESLTAGVAHVAAHLTIQALPRVVKVMAFGFVSDGRADRLFERSVGL